MIVRFRAEPGQVGNIRMRFYTRDRATLLGTFTAEITETIPNSGSYQCEVGALTGTWFVLVDLVSSGSVTSDGFASADYPELVDDLNTLTVLSEIRKIPRANSELEAGEAAQRTLGDDWTDYIEEMIRKVP